MRLRADPDVRTIRQRLGMTQAELAEWLGVRMNAVWRWEHGHPMSPLARNVFWAWVRQPAIDRRLSELMTPDEIAAALVEPVDHSPSGSSSSS